MVPLIQLGTAVVVGILLGVTLSRVVRDNVWAWKLRPLFRAIHRLQVAIARSPYTAQSQQGTSPMPANLQPLIDDIAAAKTVIESATTLIAGIPGQIQTAVDKAMEKGATAEQLTPLTDLGNQLEASTEALRAAVLANTPQAPEPAPAPPTE